MKGCTCCCLVETAKPLLVNDVATGGWDDRTVLEPLLPLLMFKLTFAISTYSSIYLVLSALALSCKKGAVAHITCRRKFKLQLHQSLFGLQIGERWKTLKEVELIFKEATPCLFVHKHRTG